MYDAPGSAGSEKRKTVLMAMIIGRLNSLLHWSSIFTVIESVVLAISPLIIAPLGDTTDADTLKNFTRDPLLMYNIVQRILPFSAPTGNTRFLLSVTYCATSAEKIYRIFNHKLMH